MLLSHFSRVPLCNPIDGSPPVPPSLGFSRQEHWSGLPFPSPMHESEKWKGSRSVVSDSSQPHGLQPTRFLRPWDFPGKSTGVGCHCLLRTVTIGTHISDVSIGGDLIQHNYASDFTTITIVQIPLELKSHILNCFLDIFIWVLSPCPQTLWIRASSKYVCHASAYSSVFVSSQQRFGVTDIKAPSACHSSRISDRPCYRS